MLSEWRARQKLRGSQVRVALGRLAERWPAHLARRHALLPFVLGFTPRWFESLLCYSHTLKTGAGICESHTRRRRCLTFGSIIRGRHHRLHLLEGTCLLAQVPGVEAQVERGVHLGGKGTGETKHSREPVNCYRLGRRPLWMVGPSVSLLAELRSE